MLRIIFRGLHWLIGLGIGLLVLPIAYIQVFFPLGIALAVIVWPIAFVISCVLAVTAVFWVPALICGLVTLGIIGFWFEIFFSFVRAFQDAFRQPPQHPKPFRDVPALPSGIPASRSDSVAGLSLPTTPGADGTMDFSLVDAGFANLPQKQDFEVGDEIGLIMPPTHRGPRSYPPRRSSQSAASSSSVNLSSHGASTSSVNVASQGASTSSVNVASQGYSTTSVNSILSTSTGHTSVAGASTPSTAHTPTRRRSRTKSISFEDGSRPGFSTSHSTTSMVNASPRVSSQHGANSSTASLASRSESPARSIEGAAESLQLGQLLQEASEEDTIQRA